MLNFVINATTIEGGNIETAAGWPFSDLGALLTTGLQAVMIVAGLLCLGFLIYGGITYITSSGDEKIMERAQKTLTAAVIGLVIVVASFAIMTVLGHTLGLKITGPIRWPSVTEAPVTPPTPSRTCPSGIPCGQGCVGRWQCSAGEYCETSPSYCGSADSSSGACCH